MGATDQIKGIIWDLDNTLYRFTREFRFMCNQAAAKAAIELGFDQPYDEALKIALKSSVDHHFSLYTFLNDYGMEYKKLHLLFHDYFDETLIDPIHGVVEAIEAINLPQVVLTNGSRAWAKKALRQIEATHLFEGHEILALEDVGMVSKVGGLDGFEQALSKLNLEGGEALFIDDLDKNLKKSKEAYLNTALIHHGQEQEKLPEFIDYQFENPIDLAAYFKW